MYLKQFILFALIISIAFGVTKEVIEFSDDNYLQKKIGSKIECSDCYLNITINATSSCSGEYYMGFVSDNSKIPSWTDLTGKTTVSQTSGAKYHLLYDGIAGFYPIIYFYRPSKDCKPTFDYYYETVNFEAVTEVTDTFVTKTVSKGKFYRFEIGLDLTNFEFTDVQFELKMKSTEETGITSIDVVPMIRDTSTEFDWILMSGETVKNTTETNANIKSLQLTNCESYTSKTVVALYIVSDTVKSETVELSLRYVAKQWTKRVISEEKLENVVLNPETRVLFEIPYALYSTLSSATETFRIDVFGGGDSVDLYYFAAGFKGFKTESKCGGVKMSETVDGTGLYSTTITKAIVDSLTEESPIYVLMINNKATTSNVFVETIKVSQVITSIDTEGVTFDTFKGLKKNYYSFVAPAGVGVMVHHLYVEDRVGESTNSFTISVFDDLDAYTRTEGNTDRECNYFSKSTSDGSLTLIVENNKMTSGKTYYVEIVGPDYGVFEAVSFTYERVVVVPQDLPIEESVAVDINQHFYIFSFDVSTIFAEHSDWESFKLVGDGNTGSFTQSIVDSNFFSLGYGSQLGSVFVTQGEFPVGTHYYVVQISRSSPNTRLFVSHTLLPIIGAMSYNSKATISFTAESTHGMLKLEGAADFKDYLHVKVIQKQIGFGSLKTTSDLPLALRSLSPESSTISITSSFTQGSVWDSFILASAEASSASASFESIYNSRPDNCVYIDFTSLTKSQEYEFEVEVEFVDAQVVELKDGQNIIENIDGYAYTKFTVDFAGDESITYVTFYLDQNLQNNGFKIHYILDSDAIKVNPMAIADKSTSLTTAVTYMCVNHAIGVSHFAEFYVSKGSDNVMNKATVVLERKTPEVFTSLSSKSTKPIKTFVKTTHPAVFKYDNCLGVSDSELLEFNIINSSEITVSYYSEGFALLPTASKINDIKKLSVIDGNSIVYPGQAVYVVINPTSSSKITIYAKKKPATTSFDYTFDLSSKTTETQTISVNTVNKDMFGLKVKLDYNLDAVSFFNVSFKSDTSDAPQIVVYMGEANVKVSKYYQTFTLQPSNGKYLYTQVGGESFSNNIETNNFYNIEEATYYYLFYIPSEIEGELTVTIDKYVATLVSVTVSSDTKIADIDFANDDKPIKVFKYVVPSSMYRANFSFVKNENDNDNTIHVEEYYKAPFYGTLTNSGWVRPDFSTLYLVAYPELCSGSKYNCIDFHDYKNKKINRGQLMVHKSEYYKSHQVIDITTASDMETTGATISLKKDVEYHLVDVRFTQKSENIFFEFVNADSEDDTIVTLSYTLMNDTYPLSVTLPVKFSNSSSRLPIMRPSANRMLIKIEGKPAKDVDYKFKWITRAIDSLDTFPVSSKNRYAKVEWKAEGVYLYKIVVPDNAKYCRITSSNVEGYFANNGFMRVSGLSVDDLQFTPSGILPTDATIQSVDSIGEYLYVYSKADLSSKKVASIEISFFVETAVTLTSETQTIKIPGYATAEPTMIKVTVPFAKYVSANSMVYPSNLNDINVGYYMYLAETGTFMASSKAVLTYSAVDLKSVAFDVTFYLMGSTKETEGTIDLKKPDAIVAKPFDMEETVGTYSNADTEKYYVLPTTLPTNGENLFVIFTNNSIQQDIEAQGGTIIQTNTVTGMDDQIIWFSIECEKLVNITFTLSPSTKFKLSSTLTQIKLATEDVIESKSLTAYTIYKYVLPFTNKDQVHHYRLMFKNVIDESGQIFGHSSSLLPSVPLFYISTEKTGYKSGDRLDSGLYLKPTDLEDLSIDNDELVFYFVTYESSTFEMKYAIDLSSYIDINIGTTDVSQSLLNLDAEKTYYCEASLEYIATNGITVQKPAGFVRGFNSGVEKVTFSYNLAHINSCRFEVLPHTESGKYVTAYDYPVKGQNTKIYQPFWTPVSLARENPTAVVGLSVPFEYRVTCNVNGEYKPFYESNCEYKSFGFKYKMNRVHDQRVLSLTSGQKLCYQGFISCATEQTVNYLDREMYFHVENSVSSTSITLEMMYPSEKNIFVDATSGSFKIATKKGITTNIYVNELLTDDVQTNYGQHMIMKINAIGYTNLKSLDRDDYLKYAAYKKTQITTISFTTADKEGSITSTTGDIYLNTEFIHHVVVGKEYPIMFSSNNADFEYEIEFVVLPHLKDMDIIETSSCYTLNPGDYFVLRTPYKEISVLQMMTGDITDFDYYTLSDPSNIEVVNIYADFNMIKGYAKAYLLYFKHLPYPTGFTEKMCLTNTDHVVSKLYERASSAVEYDFGELSTYYENYKYFGQSYYPLFTVPSVTKNEINFLKFTLPDSFDLDKDFIYIDDGSFAKDRTTIIFYEGQTLSQGFSVSSVGFTFKPMKKVFTYCIVHGDYSSVPYVKMVMVKGTSAIPRFDGETNEVTISTIGNVIEHVGMFIDGETVNSGVFTYESYGKQEMYHSFFNIESHKNGLIFLQGLSLIQEIDFGEYDKYMFLPLLTDKTITHTLKIKLNLLDDMEVLKFESEIAYLGQTLEKGKFYSFPFKSSILFYNISTEAEVYMYNYAEKTGYFTLASFDKSASKMATTDDYELYLIFYSPDKDTTLDYYQSELPSMKSEYVIEEGTQTCFSMDSQNFYLKLENLKNVKYLSFDPYRRYDSKYENAVAIEKLYEFNLTSNLPQYIDMADLLKGETRYSGKKFCLFYDAPATGEVAKISRVDRRYTDVGGICQGIQVLSADKTTDALILKSAEKKYVELLAAAFSKSSSWITSQDGVDSIVVKGLEPSAECQNALKSLACREFTVVGNDEFIPVDDIIEKCGWEDVDTKNNIDGFNTVPVEIVEPVMFKASVAETKNMLWLYILVIILIIVAVGSILRTCVFKKKDTETASTNVPSSSMTANPLANQRRRQANIV
eukprot:TRINITY_DN413_c0_g1_i1.p1 TRINITY_DN413_c0_g1~~TRINITY_DN413_c0_g1_i1.p1  ORF type:complete len:2881 (+),score=807.42 TRINITY_DN413_c0_g1_i1:43-8643(+)